MKRHTGFLGTINRLFIFLFILTHFLLSSCGGVGKNDNNNVPTHPTLDTTGPSAPTGLTATVVCSTQIDLTWDASTDNVGVAGYYILRDGTLVSSVITTSYSDIGLSDGTIYCYEVVAYDAAGNTSESACLTVLLDTIPPNAPVVTAITPTYDFTPTWTWTVPPDTATFMYKLDSQNDTWTEVDASVTEYTSSPLSAGEYTLHVQACDTAGNCSDSGNFTITVLWSNRLIKISYLDSPLVEVTPFVFNDKLYWLENWHPTWETGDSYLDYREEEVRIRDLENDQIVSIPLIGYGLSCAIVWDNRVYVFAGYYEYVDTKYQINDIIMTFSDDLENWSTPVTVVTAGADEKFYNCSVTRGEDEFIMLVEFRDSLYVPFTFKFFTSQYLINWYQVPNALYGENKYVGGPALYYENGYYYVLYLHKLYLEGNYFFETRITRSNDLVTWQDAPEERYVVTYNPENEVHPVRYNIEEPPYETIYETNASDAELVYWDDKILVYFTGGDQKFCGDLQLAEFAGNPAEFLEHYFELDY